MSITVKSGLNGHKSGYPKHRKQESLLCRKNRRFGLTPPSGPLYGPWGWFEWLLEADTSSYPTGISVIQQGILINFNVSQFSFPQLPALGYLL